MTQVVYVINLVEVIFGNLEFILAWRLFQWIKNVLLSKFGLAIIFEEVVNSVIEYGENNSQVARYIDIFLKFFPIFFFKKEVRRFRQALQTNSKVKVQQIARRRVVRPSL